MRSKAERSTTLRRQRGRYQEGQTTALSCLPHRYVPCTLHSNSTNAKRLALNTRGAGLRCSPIVAFCWSLGGNVMKAETLMKGKYMRSCATRVARTIYNLWFRMRLSFREAAGTEQWST